MPKLSIDIGVKLGDSLSQLDKLNSALIKVDTTAKNLASSLKNIGNVKVDANVNAQPPAPPPPASNAGGSVKNPFADYVKGASDSSSVTDVLGAKLEELIQRSVSLKATLAQIPVFDIKGFEETNTELKGVENQIKQLQNILKSQSLNIVAPKNVPDIFKEFRSGASSSGSALDFLKQKEQDLLNKTNELRQSLSSQQVTSSGYQAITRDIQELEKELTTVRGLLNVQAPDIFADFRSGAIQAGTALEFLEKKEGELIAESANLRLALTTATSGEQYTQLEGKLDRVEKELNQVTSAIQKQQGVVNNSSGSYTRLTAAQEAQRRVTNLSNLSLINFGRVAQDLPFGILGIANNLNPLIEGLKQTSDSAKAANSSLGKELLKSLKGFGGVTLAISAVSAALSFASVGLAYWSRNSGKAKKDSDSLTSSLKKQNDELNQSYETINKNAGEELARVVELKKVIESETTTRIRRIAAIKELKSISPEIFGQLDKEKVSVNNLDAAYQNFTKTLKVQIETQRLRAQLTQATEKLINAENQLAFITIQNGKDLVKLYFDPKDVTQRFDLIRRYGKNAELALINFDKTKADSFSEAKDKNIKTQTAAVENLSAKYDKLYGGIKLVDGVKVNIETKDGKGEKSTAEKIADLYAKINAELNAINARRDLNPLEKATQSAEALKSGLGEILQLDIKQLDEDKFKQLEDRLKGFESKKITLEIELITKDLDKELKRLDERGRVLNIDVSKDKLKLFESAIDKLFEKYENKSLSPIDKQNTLATIAILRAATRQLSLDNLVRSGETAFKDLTIDAEKLNQKKILLGVNIGKEGLNLVKKAIDTINEKKIELLSEKDPVRAAELNDEISKLQGIFSQFRSVAIGESFKEYEDAAIRINEEFQRTSQFLRSDKKLEFKIETDKKRLDLVSKEIEDQLKLGISPIDPRIIFARILQTKLKLQIETDTESLKLLQEQAELVKDTLEETFSGIGEAIGTALAEGGNVAKAIGKSVLESLGGFLQQLGKQFIAASKLIQTAQVLLGTAGGIFAGVALVALGALIKGFASKGFAEGGFVSGPGSDRSDSIPARLSNGEFVVQARSVRKYGRGFMEMINNGSMPITNYQKNFGDLRFADGGFVSDARGVSRAIVNRSDFGNDMGGFVAETKISGQDLRLVLKRADSNYSKTT